MGRMESLQNKLISNYGVDNAMKHPEFLHKMQATCEERYGHSNPMQDESIKSRAIKKRSENYYSKLDSIPWMYIKGPELFSIDATALKVYHLTNTASKTFLSVYGHKPIQDYRRKSMSLGLVDEGILYCVIRIQINPDDTFELVDYGTRKYYKINEGYSALLKYFAHLTGLTEVYAWTPCADVGCACIETGESQKKLFWDNLVEKTAYKRTDNIDKMLSEGWELYIATYRKIILSLDCN